MHLRSVLLSAMCSVVLWPSTQSAQQLPEFDAATIKVSPPPGEILLSMAMCHGNDSKIPRLPYAPPGLGRCQIFRFNVRSLISFAYFPPEFNAPVNQLIVGGPGWVDSELFDVEGKAEDPASTSGQQLLLSRLNFHFHREPREVRGFALGVGKNGSKLKPSATDGPSGITFNGGTISATSAPIALLARTLARGIGAPVIDETGMTDRYEFTLPTPTAGDPSPLIRALRDLGLRLETKKISIEAIVVDKIERPVLQ